MSPIVLIAIALAFVGDGGGKKGGGAPGPGPLNGGGNACPPDAPIAYNWKSLRHDASPTTDPELTVLELATVNTVAQSIMSDEGYPQPFPNTCTRELLSKRMDVGTWPGILAMLVVWRMTAANNGKRWGQLTEAAKYRYELYRQAFEKLGEGEADEETDIDVAEVNAAAEFLASVKPTSAYSLGEEWKAARRPPPFSKKGQSNPTQTWDEWLTNLLYWRFYPQLPVKVAGPGALGATEWHALHAVMLAHMA